MDAELKKKVMMYGGGIVLVVLLSVSGMLLNRVRTFEHTISTITQERDEFKALSKTAEARIESLERSLQKSDSRFNTLLVARDAAGNPIFDKNGKPVMEKRSGSQSETSDVMRKFDSLNKTNETLQLAVSARNAKIDELTKKMSKPGMSPWEFGLFYEQKIYNLASWESAFYSASAGYHLSALGLDLGIHAGLAASPAALSLSGVQARLGLSVRP